MDQGSSTAVIEIFLVQNPNFLDQFVKVHVNKDRILGWLHSKETQDGETEVEDEGADATDIPVSPEPFITSKNNPVLLDSKIDPGNLLSGDSKQGNSLPVTFLESRTDCLENVDINREATVSGAKDPEDISEKPDAKKKYSCEICSRPFINRQHLNRHMILHSGDKPFKCKECGRGFTQSTHLKAHMLIHTKEWPYPCSVCGKAFRTSSNMWKHFRFYHEEENRRRKFTCEICGKVFMWSSNLHRHLHLHSNEKPYECTICDIRYGRPDQLKEHLRLHDPEKMFSCEQCDKKFTTKSYLKRHLFTHSSDRPFQCNLCSKAFKNVAHLNKHSARHKENKKIGRPKGKGKGQDRDSNDEKTWSDSCVLNQFADAGNSEGSKPEDYLDGNGIVL